MLDLYEGRFEGVMPAPASERLRDLGRREALIQARSRIPEGLAPGPSGSSWLRDE